MTRREFIAAAAAAGLTPSKGSAATPFPVRYAKPNPYDAVLRYVEPGSDEFAAEKEAVALEARLAAKYAGTGRFYALPEGHVRFEIKKATEYRTGIWRLPDLQVVSEQVVTSPKPYFRDVTAHVFGAVESFREQLLPGNPYWRSRLDSACGIDVYGNQGIAVADIDGDGADEIYVCQPGGLPNRLYKIGGDGSAQDITERSGLGVLDETTCALFADFRNVGRQDAVILRSSGPLYFVNQGDGTFVEQRDAFAFKTAPQGSFTGMAAADFDRDGRLDLYLCCYIYFQSEDQYQYPAPYQDARNGPPNFLFRNRGGPAIEFEDVTRETGIDENNDRFSFAPAWCDFDGDGWPDLFVANDFGRGNLYRNRNGHFRDEAHKAGLDGAGPGMSASWFDSNGDGRPDLYVSDMWTAPGQRIVRDSAFHPAARDAEAFRRHTKGNCLYRNKGDGTFEEASQGVEMGRWAWSSGGFDWDLDGTPEILIGTGMVTNPSRQDLDGFFWRQVVAKTPEKQRPAADYENGWNALNQLIREDYSWNGHEPNVFYVKQNGAYQDASGVSGLDFADDTRTFAVTDFDGDGVPDLVLKNRLGPQIRAMQNDSIAGRKAVAIVLRGAKSNRDAIGARVEVNGQVQFLSAGSGFLSQHSKKLHFGLAGQSAAHVKITWPSGAVQEAGGLEPGYAYTIVEGASDHSRTPFRERKTAACVRAARQERAGIRRYVAAGTGTHARSTEGRFRRAAWRRASANGRRYSRNAGRSEAREGRRGGHLFAVSPLSVRISPGSFGAAGPAGGWRKPGPQGVRRHSFGCTDAQRSGADRAEPLPGPAIPGQILSGSAPELFQTGRRLLLGGLSRPRLALSGRDRAHASRELESAPRHRAHSTGTGPEQGGAGIFPAGDRAQKRLSARLRGRGRSLRQE